MSELPDALAAAILVPLDRWLETSTTPSTRLALAVLIAARVREFAMTDEEHNAVTLAGKTMGAISRYTGNGPSRNDDLCDAAATVHALQNAAMAQAAARLFPDLYRLAGEEVQEA